MKKIRIGVVGCGRWGTNLIRNIARLGGQGGILEGLCDVHEENLKKQKEYYPSVQSYSCLEEMLDHIDAAAIATPASTHTALALRALSRGKHCFVEKPLALSVSDAEKMIKLAREKSCVLMSGHTFLYNAAVRKVKEIIQSGLLGEIFYIYGCRVSLGSIRKDVSALWNFCPHDFSILNYWLDAMPTRVIARGHAYLQKEVEDVVMVQMDYPKGVGAHIYVSWLNPSKRREMTVVGSKKMVIYDDASPDAKVKIYDKGAQEQETSIDASGSFGEFQMKIHSGDLLVPRISFKEPLAEECADFIKAIQNGSEPWAGPTQSLEIIRILEAAHQSIKQGGTPVEISSV